MPPRTSVDLKFVPAVQLLFLACSTVFLTSKGIPRWYFLRNSCPHELSTASSLGNCQSSVDSKQQITFRPWTTKNFTSTTSSVVFFSSTEESSLGKFPPRILTEIFPVHRGILGGKFLLTDSVGQGVLKMTMRTKTSKLRHFPCFQGKINVCIVFYVKFWVRNDLAGRLGDVSTTSKRRREVRNFRFFSLIF